MLSIEKNVQHPGAKLAEPEHLLKDLPYKVFFKPFQRPVPAADTLAEFDDL